MSPARLLVLCVYVCVLVCCRCVCVCECVYEGDVCLCRGMNLVCGCGGGGGELFSFGLRKALFLCLSHFRMTKCTKASQGIAPLSGKLPSRDINAIDDKRR